MSIRTAASGLAAALLLGPVAVAPATASGVSVAAAAAPTCVKVSYKANYNKFGVRQGDSAVIRNACSGTQRVFVNWRWPAKDSSCHTVYRGQTITIKGPFIARGSSASVEKC